MNGSVDMMGALTGLGGSTYRSYAPYADAPEEGEFDWGCEKPCHGTCSRCGVHCNEIAAFGDRNHSGGNARSTEEDMRELAVSLALGALTGAITGGLGAKLASGFPKAAEAVGKIPLTDWAKVGLFNTGDGILGCFLYAMTDGDMSGEEKLAYAFSPGHMVIDFVGGAAMYGRSKILPKIREKLPWNKTKGGGVEGGMVLLEGANI